MKNNFYQIIGMNIIGESIPGLSIGVFILKSSKYPIKNNQHISVVLI